MNSTPHIYKSKAMIFETQKRSKSIVQRVLNAIAVPITGIRGSQKIQFKRLRYVHTS